MNGIFSLDKQLTTWIAFNCMCKKPCLLLSPYPKSAYYLPEIMLYTNFATSTQLKCYDLKQKTRNYYDDHW